jgi:serine-type D-Ala-D-Ala carboxypeptidase (penicillin-binding protein 5/6)
MRGSSTTRGRLVPLLLFLAVLAVVGGVLAGVAIGAPSTTLSTEASLPGASAAGTATSADGLSATYTLTAADLGGFGGEAPDISSPAAVVEIMDSGKVLYEHNSTERRPMASTTKIMTAILIIEAGEDLDTTVKVSANAAGTWEVTKWVSAGDVLTVRQLLYALLLRSANGAAVALAEHNAGSVSAFAEKMNKKAEQLGMKDSHFVTPNGLDADGHYSTAADMALLGRHAMKNETFRKFVDTKQYTLQIKNRQPVVLKNTNTLLTKYAWVNGVKTGSTPKGDYCLVSSGLKNGREVIAVVLGNPDSEKRFADSAALLQFGIDQFRSVTVVDKGVACAEATVPFHSDEQLQLVTDGSLATQISADEKITTTVGIDKPLRLPVMQGEVYGHVIVKAGGTQVGSVNLVATKSFSAMTLGTKFKYFMHRLFT